MLCRMPAKQYNYVVPDGRRSGMPAAAQASALSATVAPAGALGFLTLWTEGQPQPGVATLNAVDGAVSSNMPIVPTTNGGISAFATDMTHLIVDILGFSPRKHGPDGRAGAFGVQSTPWN